MEGECPIGCRFAPTDQEVIVFLLRKVRGLPLSCNEFLDCDLYGTKSPGELFGGQSNYDDLFVFTCLKTAGSNDIVRDAGHGAWHHENSRKKIFHSRIGKLIGLKKLFSFREKDSRKKSGNWIMQEFSLAGDSLGGKRNCNQVLCRIRKERS